MQRLSGLVGLLALFVLPKRIPKTTFSINFTVPASGATPHDTLARVIHFLVSSS